MNIKLLWIWIASLQVQGAAALECLSCTDIEFESMKIAGIDITSALNTLLSGFQDNNCKRDDASVSMSGVEQKSCSASSNTNQETRCAYIKGAINAKVDLSVGVIPLPTFEIPMNIWQRGCQQMDTYEPTGCVRHRGDKFNLVLESILKALDWMNILQFDGYMCSCKGNLCDTSAATRITGNGLHYYVALTLSLIIVLSL